MNTSFRKALGAGPVNVEFTKVDGSKRKMRATTKPALISYDFKNGNTVEESADVVRVWDMDLKEFRSIRDASVITYQIETV